VRMIRTIRAKQETHKKQAVCSVTPKMEAICSYETSISCRITWRRTHKIVILPPKILLGKGHSRIMVYELSFCAGASYNSRYSKQFIENAKLLHWSGRFKPWSHRAAHAQVWDRYYIPDPTGQFRPARNRG
jgi:hypothetical protein